MLKQAAIFLAGCLCFKLKAQPAQTVILDKKGKDHYFETSRLIAPVFKLEKGIMESYEQFGVVSDEEPKRFKVTFPDLTGSIDTGYTFVYSAVDPTNELAYTGILIANYSRRMKPAMLYIDRNNNFDFSDDGPADTFHFILHHLDIMLHNPRDTAQQVQVRLSRFGFGEDISFKRLADEFYNRYSGSKKYVGTTFSFREQRYHIKYNTAYTEADTFNLALVDENYNGLYNEAGIDKILLDNPENELLSHDHTFDISKPKEETWFERNFHSYKVTHIDPYGKSISFYLDKSREAANKLKEGEKIPKIKFTDAGDKTNKLKWYRNKPVYIYFWNREAPGFEEDTAALRMIFEKFCPMVKVVALNYGDNPKMLNSYVEFNNIPYLTGVATKKITDKFFLEEVPYGYLTEKKLRLRKSGIRPAEVLQMLENGEIQSW